MATPQTGALMPRSEISDRIQIGHVLVHRVSFAEVLGYVLGYAASRQPPMYLVTPNAQHVVLLESDLYFREIYAHAHLVLPDGVSLMFAAKALGKHLHERVTGVDLFQSLCGGAAERGLRVFLLGGRPESALRAADRLKETYPTLQVAGTLCPPLDFEENPLQLQEITAVIREAAPHLLFVALGAPKQEYFIYEQGRKLGVPVCMGIGGAFEMVSGVASRAPKWLQTLGLEWLFRLLKEPRRLWKRYLIGNAQFIAIIAKQLLNPSAYTTRDWLGDHEQA